MSVTYNQMSSGGPAWAAFGTTNIQFTGDTTLDAVMVTDPVDAGLYAGPIDETYRDMIVVGKGTPLFYDTAALTAVFPYIASTRGATFPGNSAVTCAWNSNNGDVFTLASAIIGKMPDFTLGVAGAIMGEMEIWGLLPYGVDPATANAYYAPQTGQSYANPAVPGTAVLGRQEFTAAWSGITGFTSFQAQDKWTVSHELKLSPVVVQGRTRAFRVDGYRVMAKCIPIGPTTAQIEAALHAQGTGAAGGTRLSAHGADLVIAGSSNITVTLGTAALKSAGYKFGGVTLRAGELAWVSTQGINAGGAPSAALTLA